MKKERKIKATELWLGHSEASIFEDEIIVDVSCTIGGYCGSFICAKNTYKELKKYNKTNKGSNYFNERKKISSKEFYDRPTRIQSSKNKS